MNQVGVYRVIVQGFNTSSVRKSARGVCEEREWDALMLWLVLNETPEFVFVRVFVGCIRVFHYVRCYVCRSQIVRSGNFYRRHFHFMTTSRILKKNTSKTLKHKGL